MDGTVPSSVIIPAVAAKLKYYLDVERKEVGFDLSKEEKYSNGKHRLYQFAERHKRSQRRKENFLDNKWEASLRSYTRKSGWDKKVEINPDHKQRVQRRIKENMSSFTVPERFATNYVFLRDINWKDSDWTVHSSGIDRGSRQAVSHGEFKRLISSAANLIVATTSEQHSPHLLQHKREAPLKSGGRRSLNSVSVNIPSSCEEPSPSTKTSCLDEDPQSVNLDLLKVPTTSENIDYEIVVNTTVSVQETTPAMFIRLYGKNERTPTLSLQNPLANTITSIGEQAFTFHVKAKDVGELTDLSIRINKKDKACIWYCKKVIVKKGTKKYVFPCDDWLSPCKAMKALNLTATTRAQTAPDRDTKNVQMKKDKRRPTTTKPQSRKNISGLVSSVKFEFPRTHDGKVEITREVNNTDLDGFKISNKKSNQSLRTAEGIPLLKRSTFIRQYGPARRLEGNPGSKKAKVLVSSGKIKSNKETTYQDPSMVVKPSTIIKSKGSKALPLLGENSMDDVTSRNTSSGGDLTMQNKIPSPKYRRAYSPASYVFFALENKEPSIILEVDGCSQDGPTSAKSRIIRRLSSECENTRSQFSDENKEYVSFDKGSSELALLQDILSDSGNNVTSGSFDSWPFSSCENSEETRAQHGADDDISDVQGDFSDMNTYNKLGSMLDCESIMTTCYSCSRGEQSNYETDSTLDEEHIFSDTSPDLSLSEDDDTDSSSKSDASGKGQEERNADVMKQSKYQIRRQRRVESCNENSKIFQSSLAAIHEQDDATLRILCRSFFFLPSVTDEEGKTLLHHAAVQENPSICQVLLDTNIGLVNIDQQDKCGKTALHYAVQKDNPKTIKILLDNGAKVEIQDIKSKTVLDVALLKVQAK